jgi:hypothetical protein
MRNESDVTPEQAEELLDHLDRIDRVRAIVNATPYEVAQNAPFLIGLQLILSIHRAEISRLLDGRPLRPGWASILSVWSKVVPALRAELQRRFPGVETGDEETHYGLAHELWKVLADQAGLFGAAKRLELI